MKNNRVVTVVTALATVGALALAGCSGSTSSNANKASSSAGAAGAVLTVGRPEGPQTNNSNPLMPTSSANTLGYGWMIYEPLVQVNLLNPTAKPTPWLATAYTWNAAYTQVTFTIRDGVMWSDGQPFSAEDVAYNYELRKKNPALNTNGVNWGDITQAGNKVTVTFADESGKPLGYYTEQWRVYEVLMLPKHIWEKIADPTTDLNQQPVGTGPYVLKSWTDQAVTLVANKNYWGKNAADPAKHIGPPVAPEMRYVSYTDNAGLTTALASGEVQWGWNFIADYKTVYLNADSGHHHVLYQPEGLADDVFLMNLKTKPFNNKALRQALNIAHDRTLHSQTATSGVNPPIENVTGIAPADSPFITDPFKGKTFSPDLAAGKKILSDAGYTWAGAALVDPDGQKVTATLTNPAGWNDFTSGLEVIAATLRQLGVDAKVQTPDSNVWTEDLGKGKFQGSMRWTEPGATPWTMYQNTMDSGLYHPKGGPSLIGNFGGYSNPDADAALTAYRNATSDGGRVAAMTKIQQIWVDDVPAIAIDARPSMAEMSSVNYTGWPTVDDTYADPNIQKPGALMVVLSLKPAK